MTALPMLLTNALLGSATEDNSILKDSFVVPGTMTGVMHDDYLLSGFLHTYGRSQGMLRVQFITIVHFRIFHFWGIT